MAVRELELSKVAQTADPPSRPAVGVPGAAHRPVPPGPPPQPQRSTGFYTDTTVCIGCKACEVACKQWNQLAADGLQLDRQQLRQHRGALGHVVAAREVHRAVPAAAGPGSDPGDDARGSRPGAG